MPSEIGLLADQGHHGVYPLRMIQAGQSTVQRVTDVAKPVASLQGVTASAYASILEGLLSPPVIFFASLIFINLFQSVSDVIVSYEEAQPK